MGLKAVHVVSGKGQSGFFQFVYILCMNLIMTLWSTPLTHLVSLVVNMYKISVSGMHYVQKFVYNF